MSLPEGTKLTSAFKFVAVGAAGAVTTYTFAQAGMPWEGAAVPGLAAGILGGVASDKICEKVGQVRRHFYQDT